MRLQSDKMEIESKYKHVISERDSYREMDAGKEKEITHQNILMKESNDKISYLESELEKLQLKLAEKEKLEKISKVFSLIEFAFILRCQKS